VNLSLGQSWAGLLTHFSARLSHLFISPPFLSNLRNWSKGQLWTVIMSSSPIFLQFLYEALLTCWRKIDSKDLLACWAHQGLPPTKWHLKKLHLVANSSSSIYFTQQYSNSHLSLQSINSISGTHFLFDHMSLFVHLMS